MKNPPDKIRIAMMGFVSLMALLVTIYLVTPSGGTGRYSGLIDMGAMVTGFATLYFITIGMISEIVKRPYRVDVGTEGIQLFWRFRGPQSKTYDSVANLFIEPSAPASFWTKGTGGSIGFADSKLRYGLTHEIAKSIEQRYIEKKGHKPPLPPWAKGRK